MDNVRSRAQTDVSIHVSTEIEKTHKSLQMWNGSQLEPLRRVVIKLRNPKNEKRYMRFIVVQENLVPIIGNLDSERMGLITVHHNDFVIVAVQQSTKLVDNLNKVFAKDGTLGTLPGEPFTKNI